MAIFILDLKVPLSYQNSLGEGIKQLGKYCTVKFQALLRAGIFTELSKPRVEN